LFIDEPDFASHEINEEIHFSLKNINNDKSESILEKRSREDDDEEDENSSRRKRIKLNDPDLPDNNESENNNNNQTEFNSDSQNINDNEANNENNNENNEFENNESNNENNESENINNVDNNENNENANPQEDYAESGYSSDSDPEPLNPIFYDIPANELLDEELIVAIREVKAQVREILQNQSRGLQDVIEDHIIGESVSHIQYDVVMRRFDQLEFLINRRLELELEAQRRNLSPVSDNED
jgi:hypothetical protein